MKSLQDAIYNWLSIKIVSEARPNDTAAMETEEMFRAIVEKDHHATITSIEKKDELYLVTYEKEGQESSYRYPEELINCMLDSINEHPERYKNYN
ncbi:MULTISPECIES: hypothetical protein [Bacillus]|uniref:hypothetical protein n=1 Tax=Bacillus TaxID=1386 RepID=UPI000310F6B6|nr:MULTISPECIES: hypothetical protein [Bacillus]